MKTIGISEEVYQSLLGVKHVFEKKMGKCFSFDEVIGGLIRFYTRSSKVSAQSPKRVVSDVGPGHGFRLGSHLRDNELGGD